MEIIDNIKDTITKRIKGAFGGTFILVWLILNWRLLYIIVNFDKDCTLNEKLTLIQDYIDINYPCRLFYMPIGLAILSVISYSILNYLTYSITSFFSLRVRPFILKKIDSKKIVERARFDSIEKQYFDLDEKYTKEKSNFIKNNEEVEKLLNEKSQLTIRVDEKNKEINETKAKFEKSETELKTSYDEKLIELETLVKAKNTEILNLKVNTILNEINVEPDTLFQGQWEKSFALPNNRIGKEQFTIFNKTYLIENKPYFEIEYVKVFDQNNFVELKKTSTVNRGVLINKLIRVNDKYYTGTENDNIKVEYKRLD